MLIFNYYSHFFNFHTITIVIFLWFSCFRWWSKPWNLIILSHLLEKQNMNNHGKSFFWFSWIIQFYLSSGSSSNRLPLFYPISLDICPPWLLCPNKNILLVHHLYCHSFSGNLSKWLCRKCSPILILLAPSNQ